MNTEAYIFGELSSGYIQYPEDNSSEVLKEIYSDCKAATQIVTHRDNNIMYYCYIRKFDNSKYMGFCVAINGYYLSRVSKLFSLFENEVAQMVKQGSFIHFTKDGTLTASVLNLNNKEEEAIILLENLRREFDALDHLKKKLPPVNYAVAKKSKKCFKVSDEEQNIISASYTFGYTFIYKDKDYNAVAIDSYQGVLSTLNEANTKLIKENKNLKISLQAEKLKVRNTKAVGLLLILLILSGSIIWTKVLFPDEVTNYKTENFNYYGPLKDGKPHGVGVAIYPENDKDGRRLYVGNFNHGIRDDSLNAVLSYKSGSFFYGKVKNDSLKSGLFFHAKNENNKSAQHFEGVFKNNQAYDGVVYIHDNGEIYSRE